MKEFVKKLREKADVFEKSGCSVDGIVKDYRKSADMIEGLCEKSNISGFVEKLIERLGEEYFPCEKCEWNNAILRAVEIINQLAEEYKPSKSKSLEKQPEEPQSNFYTERFNKVL